MIWSIGTVLTYESRKKFSDFLKNHMIGNYPNNFSSHFEKISNIFDYYFDISKNQYVSWESQQQEMQIKSGMKFSAVYAPVK